MDQPKDKKYINVSKTQTRMHESNLHPLETLEGGGKTNLTTSSS